MAKMAGLIGLATTLSRILGFVRDSLNASLFGAGEISDAYFVAFRIPNLLRDLVAEGALSAAFVPTFTDVREKQGEAAGWMLASLMLNALILIMAGIVLLGEALAPGLVGLLAPGFQARPDQFSLCVVLTRWLFPFIAFMALGALFMGMHNARRRFLVPALAPALLNAVMIASAWGLVPLFGADPRRQIIGWAIGSLLGGLAQWLVQVPLAFRDGFRLRWQWPFKDLGVRRVLKLMTPAIFGNSTSQINQMVNTMFSTSLAAGTVSYLYYGQRLFQLPLGIFGVAIATASLPALATHHARGEGEGFKRSLLYALRLSLFITLPASVGLITLSGPINRLLFQYGRFTPQDAQMVSRASICYCAGIVTASWVKILVQTFYVLGAPKVPVLVGFAMVGLNLALNTAAILLLPPGWRFLGLALSTSVVSVANAGTQLWLLRRRLGALGLGKLAKDLALLGLAALVMGGAVWGASLAWEQWAGPAASRALLALRVAALIALGVLAWLAACRLMGYDALKALLRPKGQAGEAGQA
jgi:putative peptidoglycan lipid II flippase